MQLSFVSSAVATAILAALSVRAETHTVKFDNQCGSGTPQLIQGANVLSTGQDYTVDGPLSSTIAYLQTGHCGFNGENCTLLEVTLTNPNAPGSGSSTDISLIAPHAFSVQTSFSYYGGCDGQGANCDSATCPTAFFQPNDNQVQVQCESNNVNLLITFCGDATASSVSASSTASKASSPARSSTDVTTHSSSAVSHAASSTSVAHSTSASAPAIVNVASTASAYSETVVATPSTTASSTARCKVNAARRRRSVPVEEPVERRASLNSHRRHHARNLEAAGHAASF